LKTPAGQSSRINIDFEKQKPERTRSKSADGEDNKINVAFSMLDNKS
jgi:hypothetical protein